MPKQHHCIHSLLEASNAKLAADTRKIIDASLKLLQEGLPDTFLGRETYKPFPPERGEKEKIT